MAAIVRGDNCVRCGKPVGTDGLIAITYHRSGTMRTRIPLCAEHKDPSVVHGAAVLAWPDDAEGGVLR